jgi:hypothetical protein
MKADSRRLEWRRPDHENGAKMNVTGIAFRSCLERDAFAFVLFDIATSGSSQA